VTFFCKFAVESAGKKNLKFGQHFDEVTANSTVSSFRLRVDVGLFLHHPVHFSILPLA